MTARLLALAALMLSLVVFATGTVSAQDAEMEGTPEAGPACATAMHEMAGTPEAMDEELPEWQTIELTDARTGETYTVADFQGCVVYFETMATWCPNCKQQLANVAAAYETLDKDKDKVVFVAVSIETEISADDLAAYADENGFAFMFSVADADVLKAINDEFGRESLVPPSTPHVVINPDGSFGDLQTGFSSPEEIVAMVESAMGDDAANE